MRRPRTLFWKLSLLFLGILLLASVMHLLTVGRVVHELVRDYQRELYLHVAHRIEDGLPRDALAAADRAALEGWLQRRYGTFPNLAVLLFDAGGEPLASFQPPDWTSTELSALRDRAVRLRGPAPVVLICPLEVGDRRSVAVLTMHRHGRALARERWPGIWLWPFVILFVSSSLAGVLGLRLMTRRLTRLEQGVRELAAGELSTRVEPGAEDEVGSLIRSVNSMAAQLEEAMDELAGQDRARRELLADLSHELRTPLTTVTGHLELLQEDEDEDGGPRARALRVMSDEVRTLRGRVEDLLALARDEGGELSLECAEENLQRLLGELAALYRPLLEERGLELETAFSADRVLVRADRTRLRQVFENLLQNAAASTAAPGRITLRVRPAGDDEVLVEVTDTGTGIPADELPHVFDRLFRGRGRRGAGTGLGLAIARRLVELHGGRCEAESVEGEGSTFRVVLPRADAPADAGGTTAPAPPPAGLG